MGLRQRFSNAFARIRPRKKTAGGLDSQTLLKGYYGLIRSALRASVPGGWASDHYEETLHFTGWNYVAGHATALQCAAAAIEISRPVDDTVRDAWSGKAFRKTFARVGKHSGRDRYFAAIASDGASLLSKSHDQGPTEQREILPEDFGLYKLLNRPNESQSGAHLRYEISVQLSQTGTALVVKVPNRLGKTVELYSVPTCLMTPRPPSSQFPRGAYYVSPAATRTNWADDSFVTMVGYQRLAGTTIDMRDLLKISFPHPLWKDEGYSALAAGALWSDASEQIDRSRFSQFLNEARPSLIIKPPDGVNPSDNEIERVVQLLSSLYSGTAKTGRVMVAPGGCTVDQANVTPKDMDYGGGFTQLRDAIMGIHGVPLIAAGITDGGSYAAFYAALKQFIMLCVQPRLDWIAEELTYQLAFEYGPGLMVRFLGASVDDPAVLESRLATDISARSITKNEVRALRGLSPRDDGDEWVGDRQTETTSETTTETTTRDLAGTSNGGDERSTGIATGQAAPASQHFAAAQEAGNPSMGEKRLRRLQKRLKALEADLERVTGQQDHPGMYINGDIPKSLKDRLDAQDGLLHELKLREDPRESMLAAIARAAEETDTEPSEAAKQSGQYRKGKFDWNGLRIAIENPRGSVRSGVDANGKEWRQAMPHHYGYIIGRGRKFKGADGDAVDIFMGPHPDSDAVFVVDQLDDDGSFDEHKVMLGFRNRSEAAQAYLAAYERGWDRMADVTTLTLPEFKDWLEKFDKTEPMAELAERVIAKMLAKRASGAWNGAGSFAKGRRSFTKAKKPVRGGNPENTGEFSSQPGSGSTKPKPDKKKPADKKPSHGPSLAELAQPNKDRFKKERAEGRNMVEATRVVGDDGAAKIVLSNGKRAPEHIQKVIRDIPPAAQGIQVALDPTSGKLASYFTIHKVTGKKVAKTVYNPTTTGKNKELKFARVNDLLNNWHSVGEQVQANRNDPKKTDVADATWLMMEQATRPGSENDNKGTEKYFGKPMTAKNVIVGDPDKKTGIPKVTLKIGGATIPVRDEKARVELARRVKEKEPLLDSTFWLKSHGATTLEGRHVVQSKDGVRLQFIGKESVWHDHLISDPKLAQMLVDRKAKAGETGQLFDTNEVKLRNYVADLDGGGFLSKDMRTARANLIAIPLVRDAEAPKTHDEYRKLQREICEKVSHVLGNNWTKARDDYVDPALWSQWIAGLPPEEPKKPKKGKNRNKEAQTT